VGVGQGRSKKEAEQRAAERAWRELSAAEDTPETAAESDLVSPDPVSPDPVT
jgi:ribonuclease-3